MVVLVLSYEGALKGGQLLMLMHVGKSDGQGQLRRDDSAEACAKDSVGGLVWRCGVFVMECVSGCVVFAVTQVMSPGFVCGPKGPMSTYLSNVVCQPSSHAVGRLLVLAQGMGTECRKGCFFPLLFPLGYVLDDIRRQKESHHDLCQFPVFRVFRGISFSFSYQALYLTETGFP